MSKGDLSVGYLVGMALTVAVVILIALMLFGYFPEMTKDIRTIADEVFGSEAKLREEQRQQSTALFDELAKVYQHASGGRNDCVYDIPLSPLPSTHRITLETDSQGATKLTLYDENKQILKGLTLPKSFPPCFLRDERRYDETSSLVFLYDRGLTANSESFQADLPEFYKVDSTHLCLVTRRPPNPLVLLSKSLCEASTSEPGMQGAAVSSLSAFVDSYKACLESPTAQTPAGCRCDFPLQGLPLGYSIELGSSSAGVQTRLIDFKGQTVAGTQIPPFKAHTLLILDSGLLNPLKTLAEQIGLFGPPGESTLRVAQFTDAFVATPVACLFSFAPFASGTSCKDLLPEPPMKTTLRAYFYGGDKALFFSRLDRYLLADTAQGAPQQVDPRQVPVCAKVAGKK